MKDVIGFIQSVGFPIVIALLFYIDLRGVINKNTQVISSLNEQQKHLVELLKSNHPD